MNQKPLDEKVLDWLLQEGYPLEFKVANIFRENKFNTFQGRYVNDFKTSLPKEIDVLAQEMLFIKEAFLRVSYVVECKWSKDKPWIIFSDESSRIAPGACIAQTIATKTASSILWYLAGDPDVQKSSIFQTPNRPGFNGRQAFGAQSDIVYSTLQSITSACYSKKKSYEEYHKNPEDSLALGVIFIPIIVVDGKLFEAFYNKTSGKVEIAEKEQIRLHWRGAEAWSMHSTIDIVTFNSLPGYVKNLAIATTAILTKMAEIYPIIEMCVRKSTLTPLEKMPSSSRGFVGLPSLLRHLK